MPIQTPVPTSLSAQLHLGATPLLVHPVIGPTAFPIHDTDPSNPWLTVFVPIAGAFASVIAALAVIWAVRAVDLSKRAFQLAQREAQTAERLRNLLPNLHLVIDGHREKADTIVSTAKTEPEKLGSDFVIVTIENDGDKPARNIVLDLRLPAGMSDDSFLQRKLNDPEHQYGEAITFSVNALDRVERAVKPIPGILIPNTLPADAGTIYFRAKTGEYDLPWFIWSQEGTWSGIFRLGVRSYDDDPI